MKAAPQITEFETPQKNRVYRRFRLGKDGQPIYSPCYTLRVRHGQETSAYFNLGKDKRLAGSKADEISAFLSVEGNTVEEAQLRFCDTKKHRAKRAAKLEKQETAAFNLTVGFMIGRFLEVTSHLSPVTRRNNTQALRHLAAGVMGLPKLGINQTKQQQTDWRTKVEAFPVNDFTVVGIDRFRQKELRECGNDHKRRGSTSTTLNSYLRAAKGVFTKKLLPHYADLILPDPLPFCVIAPLPEPSHRYSSKIHAANLVATAKKTLKKFDAEAWIAFLLVFGAGLRREEVDKLQWEQVDLEEARIHIRTTEFFRPKAKNSEAWVDLSSQVVKELAAYRVRNPESRFVLPGRAIGGKIRCLKVFRRLMNWLKLQGVKDRTPLHTLRKEAGSLVFKEGGSIDRTAEFLRNDPRVAREHYIGRKERIELKLPGL